MNMDTGTDTGTMDTSKRAVRPSARTPMTPARWLILAVGVPALVAAIGWTGLSLVADAGTGSYQFSSAVPVTRGTMTEHFGDASVTLVPGPSAHMTGTLTYSLIRPDLTIHGSTVDYTCAVPTGQCSLNSTLTVPPATNVDLSTGTGDLTVNGTLAANIALSTDSGDLTANGLAGTSDSLTTVVGNITASAITAPDVTVHSQTGDVTLTFTRVPENVTVHSTVGNISIVVPQGHYNVEMDSGVGNTSVSSGVVQDSRSQNVIKVTSTTGDISIGTS